MFLEKEDFSLYYQVTGEGEPLLLIHGVMVDAGLYEEGAKDLSRNYKVICYDRRGNSRSAYYEKKQRTFSLEEQAKDINDLLDALSVEQAFIFGASAGAAIGQYYMTKHPERVRHLIMYEPAFLSLISREDEALQNWIRGIQELIAKRKYNRALLTFSESIGPADPEGRKKTMDELQREYGNIKFAFGNEVAGTLLYEPDLEKLKSLRDKITVAAGALNPDTVYHRIACKFAERLGKDVFICPGGHNFPFEQPQKFAQAVREMLKDR